MIISVASGKGGTGKTLVATSLAYTLGKTGAVQLLDCDVEEPNDHIFMKPSITSREEICITIPQLKEDRCTHCGKCAEVCAYNAIAVLSERVLIFPELCHGCGACIYLCPEKALEEGKKKIGVVESGSSDGIRFTHGRLAIGEMMSPAVIKAVKTRATNDGAVIIDVPPGTSCPVVEAIRGSDFCLLVTEPTPFGLNDLALAVETARILDIPCGVVLNRAGVGNEGVKEYCQKENIPILLTIPLEMEIARLYSRGITLAEGEPQWQSEFAALFNKIEEMVHERNRRTER